MQGRLDWGPPPLLWRHSVCQFPSPVGTLHGSPGLCGPHSLAPGHPETVAYLSPGLPETLGQCPARGMRLSQNCPQGQGYGPSIYNCSYSVNIIVVTWHKIQEIKKKFTVGSCPSLPPKNLTSLPRTPCSLCMPRGHCKTKGGKNHWWLCLIIKEDGGP